MVSIIILNFNGLYNDYLPNNLESLLNQSYHPLQIIVVDNNSDDESVQFVRANYPNVTLVENPENYGFCKGNNIGFRIAQGDFLVFANNDTSFHIDCIKNLVDFIHQYYDVGFVSPKIVRPINDTHSRRQIDSAGLMLRRDLTIRDRGYNDIDNGQFEEKIEVFGCCGAAFFARREALEAVLQKDGGIWDESFFSYYEDGDLSWRLQNVGWRCLYNPEAVVTHYRGASSPSAFFKKPRVYQIHTIKNRYLMIIKNAPLKAVLSNFPFILFREILIWGYLLLHPYLLKALLQNLRKTIPDASQVRRNYNGRFLYPK